MLKLVVIHPHLDVKGGSERLTKILCDSMLELGVDIKIVTARIGEEWFSHLSNRVEYLRTEDRSPENVSNIIAEIVKSYEPDAVMAMLQEPFFCYSAKKGRDVPCTMYIHFPLDEEIEEANLEDYYKHYRYPHLSYQNLRYVDAILVNARRTGLATRFLWGVDPVVAYPSIDRIFFDSEALEDKPREPVVLYVGRFVALKRQDFLIMAFEKIKREVPNAKLVITGFVDPRHIEYYEHVREVYDRARDKIKDVELIPSPSDKQLLELYREAKVYSHPRVGEHFGMAPVEALSQKVPVVIRAPTGLAEVIEHGVHGFVAKSDTELIEYTVKVLKMSFDEWSKIGRRGYTLAQNFKPRAFGEKVLSVITKLLKS